MKGNYNFGKVQRDFSAAGLKKTQYAWGELLQRPAMEAGAAVFPELRGARVLVTGAGGYIGSAMVRMLARSGAREMVLLELAEQHLFEITEAMTAAGFGERCVPVLGSVCDENLLRAVFAERAPEMVLHAAALKHVPLMERNPLAALETNALGTWRLAAAAEEHGARAMVLVSTDKAVAPQSVMGAAKRVAELAMLRPARMRKAAVRLANVIGSPCSVGPIFAEQIARGGPVTVTHREARRFFLTVGEVTQLLGEAMTSDAAGVLIPDPGEALPIAELARRMMAASGRDVEMVFTEPRPGDKLDERLMAEEERDGGAATAGLRHVLSAATDVDEQMSALSAAVAARDVQAALRVVRELVPDYRPSAALQDALEARV